MSDKPTRREREALAAWDVVEPPSGFADRVFETLDRAENSSVAEMPVLHAVPIEAEPDPTWSLRRRWLAPLAVAAGVVAMVGTGWWLQAFRTPSVVSMPTDTDARPSELSPSRPPEWEAPSPLAIDEPDLPINSDPLPTHLRKAIRSHIEQFGRNYGPAFRYHGVVAVVRGDEEIVEGFGMPTPGHQHPPTETTCFRIGTLTQQFVAVAILRYVERGQLNLDDTLLSALPSYPHVENAKAITVRQLLSHTSGLPNLTDASLYWERQYEAHTNADLLAYFVEEPLAFDPGTRFEPSNSNYVVLGMILERLGHAPLSDVLEEQIFVPAGMMDTTVAEAENRCNCAVGYEFDESEVLGEASPVHVTAIAGAGAASSTATDLIAWHRALQSDTLLSAKMRRVMHRPVLRDFGLGWVLRDDLVGRRAYSHPGGTPGFNANIVRFADGTLVLALANTEAVDARRVSEEVAALAYGHEPPPVMEQVESRLHAHKRRAYVGRYQLSEASRQRYAGFGADSLLALEEVSITDDKHLWFMVNGHVRKWMHHEHGDEFYFKDQPRTTASFERDEAGNVSTLWVRNATHEYEYERVQ